jgi:hypothetical protein
MKWARMIALYGALAATALPQTLEQKIQSPVVDRISQYDVKLYSEGFRRGDLIVAEIEGLPKEAQLKYTVHTSEKDLEQTKTIDITPFEQQGKSYAFLGADFRYPAKDAVLKISYDGAEQEYDIPIYPREFRVARRGSRNPPKISEKAVIAKKSVIPKKLTKKQQRRLEARKKYEERVKKEKAILAKLWTTITPMEKLDFSFSMPNTFNLESFGEYRKGARRHLGMDGKTGTDPYIRAPMQGKVVLKEYFANEGGITILYHGGGLFTDYLHQPKKQKSFVEIGDLVEPSQILGLVGNTGNSHGKHRHYGATVNGMKMDFSSLKVINNLSNETYRQLNALSARPRQKVVAQYPTGQ